MNFSSGSNVTTFVTYHDAFYMAVTKNVIVVALFITINYFNGTLIHTFKKHQIFNVNPRYVLFIHLVVNDMIQLTVSVTLFISSYVFYTINVSICCLLIIPAMITTQNTPLYLAGMAAECYIAICLPLRHAQLCTVKRTYILIGLIWFVSLSSTLPDLFILLATEPLEFFYSRILCIKDILFQRPYFHEKTNTSYIVLLVIVWLTLLYIYLRILFAAKAAKGDARKARNTILLHGFQLLLCMLTYIGPVLKRALFYWFPKNYFNSLFVCYIIIQILPRFLSPIVYGLRDQTFRRYLKRYLLCTVSARTNPQIALKGHT
ncbi:odorant receptor 131-2-like [Centroberyx gerrardi]|uniref:odorant receptor 131-2-like n=1 Tax=Centroberyx gerrardi TaxID=166262 RepID=UPI003AAD4E2B